MLLRIANKLLVFMRHLLFGLGMISLHAYSFSASAADTFTVDDIVISNPFIPQFDIEFSPVGNLIAWQDVQQNLWAAAVDPDTGGFMPRSGQGVLIDTGLAPAVSTGNGPEWLFSKNGLEIIYTKINEGIMSLARARFTGSSWDLEPVAFTDNKYNVLGSTDLGDPFPRIVYQELPRTTYWREINDPSSEALVPEDSIFHSSWIKQERALVITARVSRNLQCARYDLDSQEISPISYTRSEKRFGKVWRAPELGNDRVAFCVVGSRDSERIEIYHEQANGWRLINIITPPSLNYLYSPEYFVHNGKSYLVFITLNTTVDIYSSHGDVWVAGIDPASSFYRKVSGPDQINRIDPEVFITPQEVYVYYTETVKNAKGTTWVTHRCTTGLGPSL